MLAGNLLAGYRSAAIMSLLHSVRINGLDPCTHLQAVLERLPAQPTSRRIDQLWPSLDSAGLITSHHRAPYLKATWPDSYGGFGGRTCTVPNGHFSRPLNAPEHDADRR